MISRAIQWHDYSRNTLVFLFNIVNVVMVYDDKVKEASKSIPISLKTSIAARKAS